MPRPTEFARLVAFDIPALGLTVSDLRNHGQRQQRLIQREWVKQISIELEDRGLKPLELLCTSASFPGKRDKQVREFQRRRDAEGLSLTFDEFKNSGGAITQREDIDPRERQCFFALHNTTTGKIVGGITITNIRVLSVDASQVNVSAIILSGVPAIGRLDKPETAIQVIRHVMNNTHTLANGRKINFIEWRLMSGSLTRTDPVSIRMLQRLKEEFDFFDSRIEPGVGLIRRKGL